MKTPHVRLRIDFGPACAIGPGKIALLEAITQHGSISGAARALGMSYRRAWLLLEEVNVSFEEPATRSSVGGSGGGGVELTDFGRRLIALYRGFEDKVDALAGRQFREIAAGAKSTQRAAAPAKRKRLSRR